MRKEVHHLLNTTDPQLAADCWLCLRTGPLQLIASPLSVLNLSRPTVDPPKLAEINPKSANVLLSHQAPDCVHNPGGTHSIGSLSATQCLQTHNCPSLDGCTSATPWCTPEPGTLFMCGNCVYQCLPANGPGHVRGCLLLPR